MGRSQGPCRASQARNLLLRRSALRSPFAGSKEKEAGDPRPDKHGAAERWLSLSSSPGDERKRAALN